MSEDLTLQFKSLISSISELIKSQSLVENRLVSLIEESEARSITRNENSEKRLTERLESFIKEVKADVKEPLKKLLDKNLSLEYYETRKKGYLNLVNGFIMMLIVTFGGAFITLMIDNSDNKKTIFQQAQNIRLNFEKIDRLEEVVYKNIKDKL